MGFSICSHPDLQFNKHFRRVHTVGLESAIFPTASLCASAQTFSLDQNMHWRTVINNMLNILYCVFNMQYDFCMHSWFTVNLFSINIGCKHLTATRRTLQNWHLSKWKYIEYSQICTVSSTDYRIPYHMRLLNLFLDILILISIFTFFFYSFGIWFCFFLKNK